jgi:hypothetical protein
MTEMKELHNFGGLRRQVWGIDAPDAKALMFEVKIGLLK